MARKYDEVERLENKIRELKSINRHLLKKIKKLNKGYWKFLNEQEDEEKHEAVKQVAIKICFDCNTGELIKVDLGTRYFYKCNGCNKTTKSKIKQIYEKHRP